MNKKTYYAILDDVHTQLTSNYTDLYTLIEDNKTTIIQYQATYVTITNPSDDVAVIVVRIDDIVSSLVANEDSDVIVDAIIDKHQAIFELFNL